MKSDRFKLPIKNLILYGGGIGIAVLFFSYVAVSTLIGYEIKSRCSAAVAKHGGTCVTALIAYLENEDNSYRDRNSAVWALGQLGNKEALPLLQSYYTGNIPNRESLDAGLSQYELKKAIVLAGGGFNISRLVWKNSIVRE